MALPTSGPEGQTVFWQGADGNIYTKGAASGWKVKQENTPRTATPQGRQELIDFYNKSGGFTQIADPMAQQQVVDPYAAQAAAQARAEEAQRGQLRGEIGGGIQNLQNVYNQLYGDVTGAATGQRQALEQRYGRETQALGEQFNEQLPTIGRGYAARGAYDSSYRMDAEERAQKQFQRQLQDLAAQREADAAKIGQYVAEQQAKIQAQQSKLGTVSGRLGQTRDLNDLIQLRNEIEAQIADTGALRAGAMSQQQLMQRFQELAPATDRLSQLQGVLTTIMQGAAPSALKRATAQQIIGSAGLTPEEQDRLQTQINQIA